MECKVCAIFHDKKGKARLNFRERLGISISIDAEERTRKLIEEKKEEIRLEFESDLAKNVSDFWQEKEANRETDSPEPEVQENQINDVKQNGNERLLYFAAFS